MKEGKSTSIHSYNQKYYIESKSFARFHFSCNILELTENFPESALWPVLHWTKVNLQTSARDSQGMRSKISLMGQFVVKSVLSPHPPLFLRFGFSTRRIWAWWMLSTLHASGKYRGRLGCSLLWPFSSVTRSNGNYSPQFVHKRQVRPTVSMEKTMTDWLILERQLCPGNSEGHIRAKHKFSSHK